MNVLIPMSGRGHRFSSVGYSTPKPLIKIDNKPIIEMAVESIDVRGDYIFIVQRKHCELFELDKILKKIKPNSKIIQIDHITEGPACTALLAKDFICNNQELIIANCDQIMEWDSDIFLNSCRLYDGLVVTYHETSTKNSYAKINSKGRVTQIKEKQVISNISLNGIHYWKKGSYFVNSAEEMISNDERYNNEFYIGPSYNYLIKSGLDIGIYHIPNEQHNPVGVPEDLERYTKKLNYDR